MICRPRRAVQFISRRMRVSLVVYDFGHGPWSTNRGNTRGRVPSDAGRDFYRQRRSCLSLVVPARQKARLFAAVFRRGRIHVWDPPGDYHFYRRFSGAAAHRTFAAAGLGHYQLYRIAFHLFSVETVAQQWKKQARWVVAVVFVIQCVLLAIRLLDVERSLAGTANNIM